MTTLTRADGSIVTIPDPSVRVGRRICTVARLADGSTVPIELMDTPCGKLQVVDHHEPRTSCWRGHVYTKSNTYITKRGYRICKTCQLMIQRIKRQKKGK